MGGGSQAVSSMPPGAEGVWSTATKASNVGSYEDWLTQFQWTSATTPTNFGDYTGVMRWIVEQGLTTWGGNPFEGVSAYAPDARIETIEASLDDLGVKVSQLLPRDNFGTYADEAEGTLPAEVTEESINELRLRIQAEAGALGSTVVMEAAEAAYQATLEGIIGEATTAFQTRAEVRQDAKEAEFEVRLADIGGSNSSAFAFGLAGMLNDFNERVDQYDKERTLALAERAFSGYIEVFLQEVKQGLLTHAEERRLHVQHTLEAVRLLLGALGSEVDRY